MGYESLSTVVVLVIVAIIIVVWLPVRTANGMKRVDEHRQDRYSPSLHIVDAENGRMPGVPVRRSPTSVDWRTKPVWGRGVVWFCMTRKPYGLLCAVVR